MANTPKKRRTKSPAKRSVDWRERMKKHAQVDAGRLSGQELRDLEYIYSYRRNRRLSR